MQSPLRPMPSIASEAGTQTSRARDKYIFNVLDEALQQSPSSDQLSDMDSYYVGELLDFLADAQADAQADVARLEYAFFRLLEHTREPTALNHFLANDPATFITLVQQAYRGKNQEPQASDKAKQDAASQAWWVLQSWTGFPGRRSDGSIDGALMKKWVKEARLQLSDSDRGDIGDEAIGHALAHTPLGDDGAWPAEPVRQVIEMIGSRDLENGLAIGRTNARGVTQQRPLRRRRPRARPRRPVSVVERVGSGAMASHGPRTSLHRGVLRTRCSLPRPAGRSRRRPRLTSMAKRRGSHPATKPASTSTWMASRILSGPRL